MTQLQNIYLILFTVISVAIVVGLFLYYTRYLLIGKYWNLRNIRQKKIKNLDIIILKKLMPKHYLFLVTYDNVEYLIMCNEYHSNIISSKIIDLENNQENQSNDHKTQQSDSANQQKNTLFPTKTEESVTTKHNEKHTVLNNANTSVTDKAAENRSMATNNSWFNTQDNTDDKVLSKPTQTSSSLSDAKQNTMNKTSFEQEDEYNDDLEKDYDISTNNDLEERK